MNQPSTHVLPAGFGAWDVTSFPYGGSFIRYRSRDIQCRNVRESGRPGVLLADCELPDRNGPRTIASDQLRESAINS